MGYTTDFEGRFKLNKSLDVETFNKLQKLVSRGYEIESLFTWCQWIPSKDRKYIEWDGQEKFYGYIYWIKYIVNNILKPGGYELNGEVEWFGEDRKDIGKISIINNKIKIMKLKWEFKEESPWQSCSEEFEKFNKINEVISAFLNAKNID